MMETYLIYIGKAALAAGAFYLVFLALFQNRKQFTFNRLYLPVSLALSFIIPLITFTTVNYVEPVPVESNPLPVFTESIEPVVLQQSRPQFIWEWYHYLFAIYASGTALFLFRLLLGHGKAWSIIRNSRVRELFNSLINISKKDIHPFSFFSKIVLSERTLSSPHLKIIVEHEKIHVKEKHTLDILFTEILFLLQWFNPFVWLLKDAVKNNLEYKTDHQIAKTTNAQTYQLAMLALADKQGVAPFLNALNGSQLKSRIIMMKKKSANKYDRLKQLIVLPLLAVLVMGLAEREVRTEVIQNDTQVKESITSKKDNDFLLSIHFQDNNMIIKGLKGCVFKELTFSIIENTSVAINQFGIYSSQNSKQHAEDSSLSDFLLVLSMVRESIILTGSKGTNWTQQKLSYKREAFVNKFGVREQRRQLEEPERIRGKVINEKGEPFLGANIVEYDQLKRVINGTISNINGQFALELRQNMDSATVKVFYPGYKTKVIDVRNNKVIHLQLEPEKSKDEKQEKNNSKEDDSNFSIKGKVINEKGEVIPAASIFINGKDTETISDKNGNYELKLRDSNQTLLFTADGYLYRNVNVAGREKIDVLLFKDNNLQKNNDGFKDAGKKSDDIQLNSNINDKKKHSRPLYIINGVETQNIEILDPKDISKIYTINSESALKKYGAKGINGAVVIETKENAAILRSEKFSGNRRIFVDGKEVENIDHIKPENISSVNIIKGDKAVEKYGEKAKDGAVIITTKINLKSGASIKNTIQGKVADEKVEQTSQRNVKVSLSDKIVADSKPFQYLIGRKYTKVSELGDFEFKSRSSRTFPDGEKIISVNLIQGDKQIITSEKLIMDGTSNTEIYEIQDIIVLNGFYRICGGCLLSEKENVSIKSIHRFEKNEIDSFIVAFERNNKTGKYNQVVNPDKLKWNPKVNEFP